MCRRSDNVEPSEAEFLHIRHNLIGKFGVRTTPLEETNDQVKEPKTQGLTLLQQQSLLKQAIELLNYKKNRTDGEINFDFVLRQNKLYVSVQFESNYNMSKQFIKPRIRNRSDYGSESGLR